MKQKFTAVFSDKTGFASLSEVQLLINSTLSNENACSLLANDLGFYLFNDAGTTLNGPAAPGATLSNKQCSVSQTESSLVGSGNSRTVTFAVTFSNSFRGKKHLYTFARNATGKDTTFQDHGEWIIP